MADAIEAVVTDIEGTTTPVTFVTETLFPYSSRALPGFIRAGSARPEVAEQLAAARTLAGAPDLSEAAVVDLLLRWIAEDRKATPLKTLQGLVWAQGYADGTLQSVLYDDVAPSLRKWQEGGLRLFAYSSGSVAAQILLFRHSPYGDLTPLLEGCFDTRLGGKLEPDSYRKLADAIALPPGRILFLSDHEGELDAAAASGLHIACLDRDGTGRSGRHPVHRDFYSVERRHLGTIA
jgi:enolase-phosphatase E1